MTKNSAKITIIIVTYKSSHLIKRTLENIVNKGFRIIVVDNGSGDDIENVLKENVQNNEVELFVFENNCGFGRANNFALERTNSEYAFILNPDCFIDENSLNNIAAAMDKDPKIALANPLFLAEGQQADSNNNEIEDISFVIGGAMMMRMEIFQKIGFFDKNIFLYGEDDEMSDRVQDCGYKSILVKNSFAYHVGASSTKSEGRSENIRLQYFRCYHQGWGKTYLKRKKKGFFRVLLKVIHRLLSAIYYLVFKFDKQNSFIRFALFMGSMSNLLGIDCFNKDNKVIRLKKSDITQK